jgi:hypothetical protein
MKNDNIVKSATNIGGDKGTYRLGGKGLDLKIDDYDKGLFDHLGIDFNVLTQNQVDTILIPSHAPENYMMDGEITSKQAETHWFKQLVESGLDNVDVAKAMKLVR